MGWTMSLCMMWTWMKQNRQHVPQVCSYSKCKTASTASSTTLPHVNTAQKRKLTKLKKADRTTAYMFQTMIEPNRKAKERQKETEERIRRQDELLQRQEEYLRCQEVREEQFMMLMQQFVTVNPHAMCAAYYPHTYSSSYAPTLQHSSCMHTTTR